MTSEPQQSTSALAAFPGVGPGTIIGGRYEVIRLLGQGGMGAVFEAKHMAIGRRVAVKLVQPALASSAQLVARFIQEARTAAEIRHPNVVEVSDFGNEGGQLYLVMEYLQGEALTDMIERDSPVSPTNILRVLDPVMRALVVLHRKGIVHRDIKPDNIYLAIEEEDGAPVPKLLDFGIAKRTQDEVRLTQTGAAMGTPIYMAPEQVMGARDVTGAADQYALGVILFEALTNATPHSAENYNSLIIAKVTEPAQSLALLRPDLPPGLVEAIMRSLATRPEERFGSVEEFRKALEVYGSLEVTGAVVAPAAAKSDAFAGTLLGPAGGPVATGAHAKMPPPVTDATPATRVAAPIASNALLATDAPLEKKSIAPPPIAQRRSMVPWIVAGVVAIAAGVPITWRLTTRGSSSTDRASQQSASHAASPAPVPPAGSANAAPEQATLSFEFEPREAEIFFDEQRLGVGRASIVVPRDGRRHQLRVTAPGHQPMSDVVVADADARITRMLQPNPTPAAAHRVSTSGASHHGVSPTTAANAHAPAATAAAVVAPATPTPVPTAPIENPRPNRPTNDPDPAAGRHGRGGRHPIIDREFPGFGGGG